MVITELSYGVCFQCIKASILGKKLPLPQLLTIVFKLDKQDTKENDCQTLPRQGGWNPSYLQKLGLNWILRLLFKVGTDLLLYSWSTRSGS